MNLSEQGLLLRHQVRRMGWPWRAALIVVLATLLAQGLVLEPMRRDNLAQQERLHEQARRLRAPQSQESANTRALAFAASLGTREAQLKPVARVVQAAQTAGLRLDKGEYRQLRDGETGLQRYQFSFPVQATYPALRRWLATALSAEPALALQSIDLQRGSVMQSQVEARVVFVLYVRPGV